MEQVLDVSAAGVTLEEMKRRADDRARRLEREPAGPWERRCPHCDTVMDFETRMFRNSRENLARQHVGTCPGCSHEAELLSI